MLIYVNLICLSTKLHFPCYFFLYRYDLFLSFEESIFGGKQEIKVSCFETCDSCGGTGAKSSSCIKTCVDCGGKGGVMRTQKTPLGIVSQVIWHNLSLRKICDFELCPNSNVLGQFISTIGNSSVPSWLVRNIYCIDVYPFSWKCWDVIQFL